MRKAKTIALLLALVPLQTGCAVFLPAHPRSNFRRGERVKVELLTIEQMDPYRDAYSAVFNRPLPPKPPAGIGGAALPLVAAAGTMAVQYAVDFVQKQLREEASLYEAQFNAVLADDAFWRITAPRTCTNDKQCGAGHECVLEQCVQALSRQAIIVRRDRELKRDGKLTRESSIERMTVQQGDELTQNYFGIRITRTVRDKQDPAFELVMGIAPSLDQQAFLLGALAFKTSYAKAKVLSDKWWTWLEPWTWISKAIRIPNNEIDSTAAIALTAYWKGPDQTFHVDKIGGVTITATGYNLDDTKVLTPGEGLPLTPTGWLASAPRSFDASGNPVGRGTFTISVTVTERDTSNAKQYLEQAADLVGKEGKKLESAVGK